MLDPNDRHVCFLGTSLTAGVGDEACIGWAGRVCQYARKEGFGTVFYNLGIRGNTSENIQTRWYQEVFRRVQHHKQSRVVFQFGINDTNILNGKRRLSLEQSIEQVEVMFEAASNRYKALYVVPPPILDEEHNKRTEELVVEVLRVASVFGLDVIDVYDELKESGVWRENLSSTDGVHPTGVGYAEWARLICESNLWLPFLK